MSGYTDQFKPRPDTTAERSIVGAERLVDELRIAIEFLRIEAGAHINRNEPEKAKPLNDQADKWEKMLEDGGFNESA